MATPVHLGDWPPLVISTAGHIDHGKTALVRALTSIDTDRLPEERRRGITIELGFAHLTLPSGRTAAVVDVPGHERFVRHMVAGAQGVDLVLLVVAADDGVMEQTREHLEVCDLLGCGAGVVAITKADLAEATRLDLVEQEVRDLVAPTFLATAPIVRCSAATNTGLDDLRAALDRVAATIAGRAADRPLRLGVDRCFTLHGFGTVATGTLLDGSLAVGDRLVCLPAGVEARVRGLERHNQPVARLAAGARAAVNLAGVAPSQIGRGSWLCHPDTYAPERLLTVEVTTLTRTAPPLTGRLGLRLHLSAAAVGGRVRPLAGREIAPGATAIAQLTLASGVVALPGDRFVLRTPSPAATVGGGRILAIGPPRLRPKGGATVAAIQPLTSTDPDDRLACCLALADRHGIAAGRLPYTTGLAPGAAAAAAERLVAAGRAARGSAVYFAAALLPPLAIDLVTYLARRHAERPFEGVVSLPELLHALHLPHAALVEAVVATTVEVVIEGSGARLASHRVRIDGSQAALRDRLLALLGVTPFAPPTASEAATVLGVAMAELEPLLAHLGRTGEVMRIGADRYYLPAAIVEVERQVRTHLAGHPSLTVAEFKALFALTRRHAIPLLEHLDRTGITRRDGEVRRAVERRG